MTSENTRTVRQDRPFIGLDIVRLGAALLVTLYHLSYWWWIPLNQTGVDDQFRSALDLPAHLFSGGWVGVQIFFVLSGFVIAFSANQKNARQFVIGRIARLYPAAWICATITFCVSLQMAEFPNYLRAMTLSPIGPWISGVYWTLAVEIIFYALVMMVLAIWGSKALAKFGIILGCYSSAFWLLHVIDPLIGSPIRPLFTAVEGYRGYLLLLHHGCDFALGMMLWKWAQDGVNWKVISASGLFLISGLMGVAGMSRAISPILATPAYTPNWHAAPLLWLGAIALVGASIKWNDVLWSWVGRWSAGIRFIGLMTYPLYLVHSEVGMMIVLKLRGAGAVPAMIGAVLSVLALAALIAKFERYPRKLILSRISAAPAVARVAASDLP